MDENKKNLPVILSLAFPGLAHIYFGNFISGLALILITLLLSVEVIVGALILVFEFIIRKNLIWASFLFCITSAYGFFYTAVIIFDAYYMNSRKISKMQIFALISGFIVSIALAYSYYKYINQMFIFRRISSNIV